MTKCSTMLPQELVNVFNLTVPEQSKILKVKILERVNTGDEVNKSVIKCNGCEKYFETLGAHLISCKSHVGYFGQSEMEPIQVKFCRKKCDVTPLPKFICRLCSTTFTNGIQYFDHMDCHESPWLLKCDICNLSFKTGIQSRKHSYRNHPEQLKKQLLVRSKLQGKYLTPDERQMKKLYAKAAEIRIKTKLGEVKLSLQPTLVPTFTPEINNNTISLKPETEHEHSSDKIATVERPEEIIQLKETRSKHRKLPNMKCPLCPLIGFTITIQRHFNTIHNLYEDNPLCPICHETWPSVGGKNHHMSRGHQISWINWLKSDTKSRVEAGETNFDYCRTCFIPLKPNQQLGHQLIYHSRKKMKLNCRYCNLNFSGLPQRLEHERTFHPEKLPRLYICDMCGVTISNRTRLLNHMELHIARDETKDNLRLKKYFDCKSCEAKFLSNQALKVHTWKMHERQNVKTDAKVQKIKFKPPKETKLKDFICDKCGVLFTTLSSFENHQKINKCVWESIDYTRKRRRLNHSINPKEDIKLETAPVVSQNSSSQIFQCQICSWVTRVRTRLKAHITRTHKKSLLSTESGVNLHCPVCRVLIKNKGYYNSHLQLHGAKDKVCDKCGKGFSRQIDLNAHVKLMHCQLRKIKIPCRFCCRSFNNYCSRRRHEAKVHEIAAYVKSKKEFLDVIDETKNKLTRF